MKLSDWAKREGIAYQTAFKWFKAGKIPNSYQYDTGTIIVNDSQNLNKNNIKCVIYCRVSNQNRKKRTGISGEEM
jgi:putative resolvase